MKRGDGMPFWIIIMAIIAIIVLVILITIFGRETTDFSQNLKSCTLRGGECMPTCPENAQKVTATCEVGQECCVVLNG